MNREALLSLCFSFLRREISVADFKLHLTAQLLGSDLEEDKILAYDVMNMDGPELRATAQLILRTRRN